ncbi:DUF6233 domain-containing protein [Streptomyces sp. NPDC001165]|uniref:DUF6233 domain-containing protein n=1 Tax=Streptomyces sp. NPDC001165 TaxID=3364546 RepID=UPI0036C2BE39
MSELPRGPPLPSDPPRLREILAYLDEQLAKTEAIAIYLRLQRDKVKAALARAEGPAHQERPRTPHGPEPAFIHLAYCTMIEGTPHRIRPDEARAALTDPKIEPCRFCRPDTELGTDLA